MRLLRPPWISGNQKNFDPAAGADNLIIKKVLLKTFEKSLYFSNKTYVVKSPRILR
jgi:hypothetical protein